MLNYLTKLYQLGSLPVILPGTTQRIDLVATSTASAPVGAGVVRLVATVDCYLAFGTSPTADNNGLFLPANTPEYFACASTDRVAGIRGASDGLLFITPAV
jgi:hypothetical protein